MIRLSLPIPGLLHVCQLLFQVMIRKRFLLGMTWWFVLPCLLAAEEPPLQLTVEHPLKPADTSSPQATLRSFRDNMNKLYTLVKDQASNKKTDEKETGNKKPSEAEKARQIKEQNDLAFRQDLFQRRAVSCLDLSKLDPEAGKDVGQIRAVLLMEILLRLQKLEDAEIPNAEMVKYKQITRWSIPNTEITIAQVEDGPHAGEFLFVPDTVERIPVFYDRIKHIDYQTEPVLKDAPRYLISAPAVIEKKETPLEPADTTSPQTTLKTFIENMNVAYHLFKDKPNAEEAIKQRKEAFSRALRCLDLSELPPGLTTRVGSEKAVLLMEVLQRIAIPPYEQIPSAKDMAQAKKTSWSIPNTDITITQMTEGPRKGEYLFSKNTMDRVSVFYTRVKDLPYKTEPVFANAYDVYLNAPGPGIATLCVAWLPAWMKVLVFDQPLWKWLSLVILALLSALVFYLAYRLRGRPREDGSLPFWRKVLIPLCGLVLPLVLGKIIQADIRIRGDIVPIIDAVLIVVFYFAAALLALILISGVANAMANSTNMRRRGFSGQVVKLGSQVLSIVVLVAIILRAAQDLGIPLTPVLAGLGVGGVAIALAAQNSIENLLGGLNLFVDRPIRVGDFCRFGDKIGTVEEIGLRSTRVRTLDDTVITVPNATFSRHELENYSKRRKLWYHPRLRLRLETTPDQLRYLLVEIRKMLYSHPKVDPEPARIRFIEMGESSLDLDIFAYIQVTDYGEFLEVAEDLNLRILSIISQAGTGLAVPARRTYMENDPGMDRDRTQEVERTVNEWREHNTLHLPGFPPDKIAELRGSLEYPPQGSSRLQESGPQDGALDKPATSR